MRIHNLIGEDRLHEVALGVELPQGRIMRTDTYILTAAALVDPDRMAILVDRDATGAAQLHGLRNLEEGLVARVGIGQRLIGGRACTGIVITSRNPLRAGEG